MKSYYQKDLYKILEISKTATEAEIKTAFRKLARIYHPDVNKDASGIERFKEIKEAYEILINPQEKKYYDQYKGYINNRQNQSQAKKAYNNNGEKRTYSPPPNVKYETKSKFDENSTDHKNDKEPFTKVFNDILEGLFTTEKGTGKKTNRKQKPIKGTDITMKIEISYLESLNGTNRKVNILHTEVCPNCCGNKFINGATCHYCKGKGEISLHKKLNVKIPANVPQNAKIRVANEGNKGLYGGKNGDLFLIVDIENDKFFKYEGRNVICEIPISPYEAALGTNIEVPTLDGKVTMKIPPLTSSGQKFRLTQEGILDPKTSTKGDQVVTIRIEMPQALSLEEIQLYEKLKAISKEDVRKNIKNGK
ncbi:MAG: DnaJ C-terminal domain-containing protein [Candidatus Gastranaerophilales bacterium]|nr:DnaJ C-terminal domain-containing protein [Candidatus Gastranaerophilales bacterium]